MLSQARKQGYRSGIVSDWAISPTIEWNNDDAYFHFAPTSALSYHHRCFWAGTDLGTRGAPAFPFN